MNIESIGAKLTSEQYAIIEELAAGRVMTLGAKAAMSGEIKSELHLEAHMTRRYIWAIIRARVGE